MPTTSGFKKVKLKISTAEKTGAKWEKTTGSDGKTEKPFWYKYSGGNTKKKNGKNVSVLPPNPESFEVEFTTGLNTKFEFVEFSSSPDPNEITGIIANSGLVEVTDQNTKEGKFYWSVKVKEISTEMTFYCDPGVVNRK